MGDPGGRRRDAATKLSPWLDGGGGAFRANAAGARRGGRAGSVQGARGDTGQCAQHAQGPVRVSRTGRRHTARWHRHRESGLRAGKWRQGSAQTPTCRAGHSGAGSAIQGSRGGLPAAFWRKNENSGSAQQRLGTRQAAAMGIYSLPPESASGTPSVVLLYSTVISGLQGWFNEHLGLIHLPAPRRSPRPPPPPPPA